MKQLSEKYYICPKGHLHHKGYRLPIMGFMKWLGENRIVLDAELCPHAKVKLNHEDL